MQTPFALTIPEAVEASRLSRSAIYEALKSGDLVAIKAKRRTLIRVKDLEAYLASLPTFASKA